MTNGARSTGKRTKDDDIAAWISQFLVDFNNLSPSTEFFLGALVSLLSLLAGGFLILIPALLLMFHAFYKQGKRTES
jgi:F0F1-type ATP synthase assembly protein I